MEERGGSVGGFLVGDLGGFLYYYMIDFWSFLTIICVKYFANSSVDF